MQTIEKALHQPMPFTTGGQTISDRLNAAKHSLAGSQLGKTICKATTEELMAPKKKHLDYLLHCTNEPNVSIPSMANLLIERTQNPNWTVVYKSLITIHNIMCYGNERFSQYLASCNTTFNLGNFLDKNSTQGYDMSQHVRRYGKYIGEKIATYRVCAFDFCKVKRGREDGLLRTMHTDKLLTTLPILQNQIDALLEFQVNASELSNGVINCSFILLFRDLIRLFACYNDGIINLLEKYFDMNKKQCRNALDTYKGFLNRLDKVSEFLRVAESVGIDKGEIPDLTRAPASLLEALESHLHHLEGGRGPPPGAHPPAQIQQQIFQQMFTVGAYGAPNPASMSDVDRQKYIEMEKERMKQFEEQRRQGGPNQGATFNPFATGTASPHQVGQPQKSADDLVDFFTAPNPQSSMDPSNPFATFGAPTSQTAPLAAYPNDISSFNPFAANASPTPGSHWSADFAQQRPTQDASEMTSNAAQQAVQAVLATNTNPFGSAAPQGAAPPNFAPNAQEVVQSASVSNQSSTASTPLPVAGATLGIYENTPFSRMDGSYTAPSMLESQMQNSQQQNAQNQPGLDQSNVDSAISSLASNLTISGAQNDVKPVQWGGAQGQPPRPMPSPAYNQAPITGGYSQAPTTAGYGAPAFGMPTYGLPSYGQQPMWPQMGVQAAPGLYGAQQPAYGGAMPPPAYGYSAAAPTMNQQSNAVDNSNPFGNPFS